MLETHHRLIIADARKMLELDDCSIDLIVTSPPYWSIKDYGHDGQIGYNQPYEDYLADLQSVISECHRVLRPGCRAVVNIGDQYLRAAEHGRYRILPIGSDMTVLGVQTGFDFMGSIIWRKISTTKTSGGGSWMGSIYYPKDGHITYEHEYVLVFRKLGQWKKPQDSVAVEKSRLTKEQRQSWFRGVWDDIRPDRQDEHAAMFPLELPSRIIRMYSFWGETILDPFMGSGTTALAAALHGRHSAGYEVNPSFEAIYREKLQGSTGRLFDRVAVEVSHRAAVGCGI